jgi:hypothetical protein
MSKNWIAVNAVPVLDAARIHLWRIPVSKFVSGDVLHRSLPSDDEWARTRGFFCLKMRGCGLVDHLARIEMHPRSRSMLPHQARDTGEARPCIHLAVPSTSDISALVADRSGIAIELLSLSG